MIALAKEEISRGQFKTMEGDIDNRSPSQLDLTLHQGFKIDCGLRGSKLSGGQK